MPLVDELLENLEFILWFCSLDMASGFWVVPMTDRARLISAFITPFGLFEWLRMPFGLRNAPQIYQRLIDNALYGFLKLTKKDPRLDVFKHVVPENEERESVLGRRSYIDDILVGATSWDDLCIKVENLLTACDQWNLSISVEKSSWGMSKVDYLGHSVSSRGLEAKPKNLDALSSLEFPRTLKALQSFLGSLNYYHRFIADSAVYASVLYSLSEEDFKRRKAKDDSSTLEKWKHAETAFEQLKLKIADTPLLHHFNPELEPVIIVYASEWAVSAVLTQQHDNVYMPVKFTSRTLKPNDLRYDIVEKEVLALLRILTSCFTMLAGRRVRVLTRHTTLAWLFRKNNPQGRLSQWAALHSPWELQIERSTRGEEELLGVIAACITPRDLVDAALEDVSPRRQPKKVMSIPRPVVNIGEKVYVISFDGSAKAKREGGAFGAIIWKLPGWTVEKAASGYDVDLTVNEAEYRGLLLALDLLNGLDVQRLIVCGDSNLAIRQLRNEMDCKALGLQLLRKECWNQLKALPKVELFHVRRD
ncbi:hypothetical protein PF011_g23041 [Phytophthora fragariae]|uniref:Reverse transcriptase domain-containing protein n=1 Tax=Phytophthora fragariae TaxID=53985 RepID=A0A6A3IAN1_9STRA|nr:hypothetical protein PF011_g23041 [Phytophthora fragariae]